MKSLLFTFLALLSAFAASATCTASFTTSINQNTVTFTNTSTHSGYVNPYTYYTIQYGDGAYGYPSGSGSVTHSYANAGTYYVILNMYLTDSNGTTVQTCTDTFGQSITITPPPCFSTISMSGSGTNLTRTFTANNSTPGATFTWYFGDGGSASGSPATHTYAGPGTYYVSLVTSAGGCIDSALLILTIQPTINCSSLNASFTSTPIGSGTNILFNNTSTYFGGTVYTSTSWNFGDGSGGSGNTVLHAYSSPGTYNVQMISYWIDSMTSSVLCNDTAWSTITVNAFNCSTANATFSSTVSGATATFYNTSAVNNNYVYTQTIWNFGDGSGGSGSPVSHTYSAPGTYNVSMSSLWIDSATQNVLCMDSAYGTVTISNPTNVISGYIFVDSNMMGQSDSFKVWLIKYNDSTQMLYAVDSQYVGGPFNSISYAFYNKPAGTYRTKAKHLNGPASGTGLLPTYHQNSLYWYTATVINHSGGSTLYKTIHMQQGTVTSGPGFIGGNVTMGANKGTAIGDPVADLLVFLRDAAGNPVGMTYTDAAGNYSFSNLPVGNYSVWPEAMNYTTTPYTSIVVNNTQTTINNVFFKQTEDLEIKPIPTSADLTPGIDVRNRIFPNPAHGRLYLASGTKAASLRVRVVNMTGVTVAAYDLGPVEARAVRSIQVDQLPAGLYLIRAEAGQNQWTEKIQIK